MTAVGRKEWRWRTYPRAVVYSIIAAALIVTLAADDADSLPEQLGGDLPTFYSAGEIVRSGDGDELFDLDRQFEAQEGFWEDEGSLILYVYPPAFAAPYVPLSALDYRVAYLIQVTAMFGAVLLSLRLLGGLVPLLADPVRRFAALAFGLLFLPMFVGSMVGQNTALFVLALVAVWWGLDKHRDTVAGIASGLLLLKPQYGVPVLGLVFLARRWSAFGTALLTAAALWAVSVLISGPGWVADWWQLVRSLSEVDSGSNLLNEVSILGVAESVLGAGSGVALAISVVLGAAVVAAVLWRLWRRPLLDPFALALVPPMLLLIAPHSLYYDAGALLLSLAVLLPTAPSNRRPLILIGWLLGGLTYLLNDTIGFQPVTLLVVATFGWAWWASSPDREFAPDTRQATPADS